MKEIVFAVRVEQVWRLPSGTVHVACGDGTYNLAYQCAAEDAPRVGEAVGVRVVEVPRNKNLRQALGIDGAASDGERHDD